MAIVNGTALESNKNFRVNFDRHAAAGHAARKGSRRHVSQRHRAAGAVLRRGERADEHPAAAGRGHRGGEGKRRTIRPPPNETPTVFESVREQWRRGAISAREAGRRLGVTHSTFLRWAKEDAGQ